MRKVRQTGLTTVAGAIGKIATPRQALISMAAAAALLLPASQAFGVELDLTTGATPPPVPFGPQGALFSVVDNIPTGTGVFNPFLSIESPGNFPIEQGYNTSGGLPLDDKRPNWNKNVQVGQLDQVSVGGINYYVFELDANETGNGNGNRVLSIDNIRIYTSPTGSQTTINPDDLGKLRYALNDTIRAGVGFNTANWIKIDSSKADGGSTSGSGSSDMKVYIPVSLFADASPSDYLYFFNLNGAHFDTVAGTGADAGPEEWRALTVPDGGNSLVLLGSALTALGIFAGRRNIGTSV